MFLDHATITVIAGKGGDGCVAWRREKYVPKGGPAGGDGGHGGSVYFVADSNTDTLSDFASRKRFEAEKGLFGSGSNKHGRNGEDLYLKVPPGTVITDRTGEAEEVVADLQNDGDQILIVRGGRGGYGNAHFKSSTRQRPDFAEKGEPGEEKELKLDLKLVADVGIIGFPSVGKSTLISVISNSKPKIAEYEFTTLIPNLGVVTVDDRSYVVCDVPGLIEGASEGKGLGDKFLRHIERCGILLHILDLSHTLESDTPTVDRLVTDYQTIRSELERYSPTLSQKKEIVVLNKVDLLPQEEVENLIKSLRKEKIDVQAAISAATHGGTEELTKILLPLVLDERAKREEIVDEETDKIPVLQPHLENEKMGAYSIEVTKKSIIVHGKRIEQLAKMTDFSSEGGVRRFRDVVERIGLKKALEKEKERAGIERIFVGEVQIDGVLN